MAGALVVAGILCFVFFCAAVFLTMDNEAITEQLFDAQHATTTALRDADLMRESNECLTQACQLHIEEIRRLEAVRDAMQEEAHNRHDWRSEASKKGWATRKARKLKEAA